MAISSIHFQAAKGVRAAGGTISETHNQRKHSMPHIHAELTALNESDIDTTIADRYAGQIKLSKKLPGRSLRSDAHSIREAVVNLNSEHTLLDLQRLSFALQRVYKIKCFQIYIHRDEGKILNQDEPGDTQLASGQRVKINHHAHMLFDWQDPKTAKIIRLSKLDLIDIQTLVAKTLNMQRGKEGSKAVRLEAQAYKATQEKINAEAAHVAAQKKTLMAVEYGYSEKELSGLEKWKETNAQELQQLEQTNKKLKETKPKELQQLEEATEYLQENLKKKIEKSKLLAATLKILKNSLKKQQAILLKWHEKLWNLKNNQKQHNSLRLKL